MSNGKKKKESSWEWVWELGKWVLRLIEAIGEWF